MNLHVTFGIRIAFVIVLEKCIHLSEYGYVYLERTENTATNTKLAHRKHQIGKVVFAYILNLLIHKPIFIFA